MCVLDEMCRVTNIEKAKYIDITRRVWRQSTELNSTWLQEVKSFNVCFDRHTYLFFELWKQRAIRKIELLLFCKRLRITNLGPHSHRYPWWWITHHRDESSAKGLCNVQLMPPEMMPHKLLRSSIFGSGRTGKDSLDAGSGRKPMASGRQEVATARVRQSQGTPLAVGIVRY